MHPRLHPGSCLHLAPQLEHVCGPSFHLFPPLSFPWRAGYTASAGIAANKLLAKIGSAMHKPNIQTVIPPRSAQLVMQVLVLLLLLVLSCAPMGHWGL